MSAVALATLRKLWEKLTFARVKRVIAREPEDVLSISVFPGLGGHPQYLESRRMADVPEKDRTRARISWRHYFGFTDREVYFQKDNYHELDFEIDLTMDFSNFGNHMGGWDKPEVDSLIGGEVVDTSKGRRFSRWFMCRPELKFLVDIVRNGTTLPEDELGRKLLAHDYPDKYWAIARLVFFDNVQAFVDNFKHSGLSLHPAHGMSLGVSSYSGEPIIVQHQGMYLSKDTAQYLHEISWRLGEPRWWQEFKRLTAEQGIRHEHPGLGGWCYGCQVEHDRAHPADYTRLADFDY